MKVVNTDTAITRGLERLATVSATGVLRTFVHLSVVDPISHVLANIRQRHIRDFLPGYISTTPVFSPLAQSTLYSTNTRNIGVST